MRSMKVKVAKTAGFCFGVKRAVDKVYQLIEEGVSPIYTLGPSSTMKRLYLIWNPGAFR